jgi:hypothetical protein
MNTQTLNLSQIRIDGGTQPRVEISEDVLAEYAEQLREGVEFPPVTVFFDGAAYWLADGFHRYHSHRRAGRETIVADIHDGGLREAILYSVGANTEHGLRRTNEDKRKAVETMLTNEIVSMDESGIPWNNCDIARRCRVSEFLVRRLRENTPSSIKSKIESSQRLVKRGNSTYLQNTAKIGKSNPGYQKSSASLVGAHKPETPEEYVTIELPNNPRAAARTLLNALGKKVATDIAENVLLLVTKPASARLREEKV